MFKTSKRLVAMLICLAMVLSMLPMAVFAADTITLYCVAPESWTKCNVYAWNDDGNNGDWPGVAMTKGDDGVWYAEVDAKYTKVIFNNGSGAQTSNLDMPTDENVQFTVDGGWGPYGSVVEVEVFTIYVSVPSSWSAAYVYLWNAGGNNGWPGAAMTKVDGNIYKYDVPVAAAYTSLIFNNGSGGGTNQTADLTMPTAENSMYIVDTAKWGTYSTECTHENVATLEAVAATCISAGKTEGSVCADCGESIVAQEEVPALGHSGAEGEVCANCGETLSYITVYFQNNWEWTDISVHFWGSAIEADTTWPGKAAELYGNDGTYDIYAIKVPADIDGLIFNGNDTGTGSLNQTPNIVDAVDGNCYYMVWDDANAKNAVGYENIDVILPPACEHEYEYDCSTKCKLCGEETRPEAKHEYFYACDPVCMNCGELTNENAAHSLTYVAAVEATECGSTGNIEYWTCEHCGGCWDNENATGMPLNRMMVITYKDHNYENGFCTECGDVEYDIKYQVKEGAIRLITYVDDLASYNGVTFTVIASNGSLEKTVTKAYSYIYAGEDQKTAEDLFGVEGGYLVLLTVEDLPSEYEIEVVVTWHGVDGSSETSTRYITVSTVSA